jgi:hypothetical protein
MNNIKPFKYVVDTSKPTKINISNPPTFKTINVNNEDYDYGNLKEITHSTMRQNFALTIGGIEEDKNIKGQSAGGGGNYVYPLFDKIEDTKIINPYPNGGYLNYLNAYGSNAGYCTKNNADAL